MENPVISLLAARKAGRSISTEPLSGDEVTQLAEAARLTPSCYNKQPWRFLFLQSEAALTTGRESLSEGNRGWASRAPLLVVAYSRQEDDCVSDDGRAYHQFDLGMAVMNLMLAATARGLVARPMAGFDPEQICAAFGLSDGYRPLVMVAVGKPSDDETHLPEHFRGAGARLRTRKAASDIAKVL